jgi:hypothetical protein
MPEENCKFEEPENKTVPQRGIADGDNEPPLCTPDSTSGHQNTPHIYICQTIRTGIDSGPLYPPMSSTLEDTRRGSCRPNVRGCCPAKNEHSGTHSKQPKAYSGHVPLAFTLATCWQPGVMA